MTISQACNDYHALVCRYARKHTHDADDLAQDVMLKVCRCWTHEQETWTSEQIKAWLWQITRNTAIDRARKARLHAMLFQELTDCHYAPIAIESDVEQRELLRVALSRLPTGQRDTLLLAVQGCHYAEIEAREHSTPSAVKSRLNRARAAMATFKREWEQVAA